MVLREGLEPPTYGFSGHCVYQFHHLSICHSRPFAGRTHYNFVTFEVWFWRCQQTNYPLVGVTLFCALVRQAGLEPAMPSDA